MFSFDAGEINATLVYPLSRTTLETLVLAAAMSLLLSFLCGGASPHRTTKGLPFGGGKHADL
jgi:hypothetical protein